MSQPVNVYVLTEEGKNICVGRNMNRHKLTTLSPRANDLLNAGGIKTGPAAGPNNIALFAPETDLVAAGKVIRWIQKYDLNKPAAGQGLSLKDVDPRATEYEFPDALKLYYTSYSFHVPRDRRGDDLRDAIYEYIHMAALTRDEFIMLHEGIPFDKGMLKTAQHQTMWLKVIGPAPPQLKEIEEYAKQVGVWQDLVNAENHVRNQKARDVATLAKFSGGKKTG